MLKVMGVRFLLVFRLRELCEAAIADLLDLSNAVLILQYAEFYGALGLTELSPLFSKSPCLQTAPSCCAPQRTFVSATWRCCCVRAPLKGSARRCYWC